VLAIRPVVYCKPPVVLFFLDQQFPRGKDYLPVLGLMALNWGQWLPESAWLSVFFNAVICNGLFIQSVFIVTHNSVLPCSDEQSKLLYCFERGFTKISLGLLL